MAHIYVSSVHGTNTGGSDTSYGSQQTGAMTSLTAGNVYDNIGSAVAGRTLIDGDVIYVADNHSASYDNGGNVQFSASVKVVSVSASNIDQYSPGATENLTDTSDVYQISNAVVEEHILLAGLDLEAGDDVIRVQSPFGDCIILDTIIRPDTSGDVGIYSYSANRIILVNVDIIANSSGAFCFKTGSQASVYWYGGSAQTLTTLNDFGSEGLHIEAKGVDLSPITTVYGGNSAHERAYIRFDSCKLNSSISLPTWTGHSNRYFEMFNCDDASGGAYHRFYVSQREGTVKNNDSTYVTATESWYEGSSKSSIEVTTSSTCSHSRPFIFELPAQYVDLSQAASDVLTLDLVTDSTALSLTDTDIAAFLVYPDGTTAVQANWVTSGKTVGTGNYGIDPLSAGTALSASSLGAGDWTGEPASANFYKMDLDTSGDAGQATAVSIRIEVYKASIASGALYIHPLISTS